MGRSSFCSPTASTSPRDTLHCTGYYMLYKTIGITVYTAILAQLMDGWTYHMYKLATGILITPIIKYLSWKPENSLEWYRFIYSIIADTGVTILALYIFPIYFAGWILGLTGFLSLAWDLPMEYGEYWLFDKGTHSADDQYVIKLTKNPLDYLLAGVIGAAYALLGWYIDIHTHLRWDPVAWYSFLTWLLIMAMQDAFFGAFHWLLHTSPTLWQKHKLHHEYKREDLNMFASFYADILDSIFMASCYYISFIMSVLFGGATHHVMTDAGTASIMSHNKYVMRRGCLVFFWEYDALDMLFGRIRLSEYHYSHHMNTARSYGLFGFIPDSWYPRYVPKIINALGIHVHLGSPAQKPLKSPIKRMSMLPTHVEENFKQQ